MNKTHDVNVAVDELWDAGTYHDVRNRLKMTYAYDSCLLTVDDLDVRDENTELKGMEHVDYVCKIACNLYECLTRNIPRRYSIDIHLNVPDNQVMARYVVKTFE